MKKLMYVALSSLLFVAGCGDDESGNSSTNNTAANNVTTNNSGGNNGAVVRFTIEFANQSGGEPLETVQGSFVTVTGTDNVRPVIQMTSGDGTMQITWTKEAGALMPGMIDTEGTFTSSQAQCTTPTIDGEVLTLDLTSTDPAAGTFSGLLRCGGGTPDAFTVDVSGSFEQ